MEQSRYWMWTKRRSSHGLSSAYDDLSWEEQAFAEDAAAAGSVGGCIWPPRSYNCSFCGREFRSAQALGGHMNVHRRDRARLKQSPSPTSQQDQNHHHQNHNIHHQNPLTLPMAGFPYNQPADHDEVCNFVCSPNPNSINHAATTLPAISSTSRVSPTEETFAPHPNFSSSPIVLEHIPNSISPIKSWSNLAADRYYHFSDIRSTDDGEKSPRILESGGCRVRKADYVQTDLSVSLSLVVRTTCPEEEETVGRKRKRSTDHHTPTLFPFFLDINPISNIETHDHLQPADQVTELKPSSVDGDIDLELRLGERPKVKKIYSYKDI